MSNKVYLISDGYYKGEYPMHTNLNVEKFYAVLSLEQRTSLVDLIGDNLLGYLYEYAADNYHDQGCNDMSALLTAVQQVLVFYVARGLEEYNTTANDTRIGAINNKVSFMEKRVKDVISSSQCLTTLKGDDIEPDRESYNGSPTVFWTDISE
jgi:hypothetical protein